MPCFMNKDTLITEIRARLTPTSASGSFLGLSSSAPQKADFYELADRIIKQSVNSFFTEKYDQF